MHSNALQCGAFHCFALRTGAGLAYTQTTWIQAASQALHKGSCNLGGVLDIPKLTDDRQTFNISISSNKDANQTSHRGFELANWLERCVQVLGAQSCTWWANAEIRCPQLT